MTQVTEYKNSLILKSNASVDYNLRDVYEHMGKTSDVVISYHRFKEIFLAVNQAIMNYVLSGYHFKFPYNLGILKIRKRKLHYNKKILRVDFAATKKHGKTIYHLNEHSSGYYFQFKWIQGIVSGIRKYNFTPVRVYKRELARRVKEENKDYA